jgi:hypothetical protein
MKMMALPLMAALGACLTLLSVAANAACPLAQASTSVTIPGRPYAVAASADGCTFYVSYSTTTAPGAAAPAIPAAAPGGVAQIEFANGGFAVTRTESLSIQPQGMT